MEAVEWIRQSSFGLKQRGWLSRNFSIVARLVEVFLLTSPFIEQPEKAVGQESQIEPWLAVNKMNMA